jgi:hypothetical protein
MVATTTVPMTRRETSPSRHVPTGPGWTGTSFATRSMEPDGEAGGRGPPNREFDSPHSRWVEGPEATQRGGMVTSRVSYARRSPVSTERCDQDEPSQCRTVRFHAPVAQPEEAAGSNPVQCAFESCRGTTPVMLGWLSARFVRGSARVDTLHRLHRFTPEWSNPIWRTIWLSLCP